MQKHYGYILWALLNLCSSCDSPHNDHIDLHLKGHVKELRIKRYKAVAREGKIVKKRLVSRNLDQSKVYEYEGLPANAKVQFGAQKELLTIEEYGVQDELFTTVAFKDTLFEMYTSEGVQMAKVVVDDRWYPNYMKVYTATGELLERTEVTYDQEHPLDRIHRDYNPAGELLATTIYEYDKAGRLIRVDTKVEQRNYHRVREEHCIELITYDAYNHPSQVTINDDGKSTVIDIQYVLDKQKNWIQSIESIDGKPSRFIERSLVYY